MVELSLYVTAVLQRANSEPDNFGETVTPAIEIRRDVETQGTTRHTPDGIEEG
jgi:hypothetical protein